MALLRVITILYFLVQAVHSETPVRTLYTCDEPLLLECQEGEKIELVRANYGRFSVSVCNPLGSILKYIFLPKLNYIIQL